MEVRTVEEGVRGVSRRVVGEERQAAGPRASASDHDLCHALCRRGWICGRAPDRGRRGTCRSSALADRGSGLESAAGQVSGAAEEAVVSATSSLFCGLATVSSPANSSGGQAIAAARASTRVGSGRSDRGRLFGRPSRVGLGGTYRDRDRVHGRDTFPIRGRDPATWSATAAAVEVTAIASFPCLGPDRVRGHGRAHAEARATSTVGATDPPSVAHPSLCHHC